MLFFVKHDDKEHRVRVESRRNRLYVAFNDDPEERVDLTFDGNDCTLIHHGRIFHANVVGNKNLYTVWRPIGNLSFNVESEYKRVVTALKGQLSEEENNVCAKMPGKIVRILTKVGQTVECGDSVVVMEAMKMENEIRTTLSGKVIQIRVQEGEAVETGAVLIELEPTED